MNIPESYIELGNHNQGILDSLSFDKERASRDPFYIDDMGVLFMKSFLSENHFQQYIDSKMSDKSIDTEPLVDPDTALVLIRPEMYHITDCVIDFLKKNQFIVSEDLCLDLKINSNAYWEMYKHAITHPNAKRSMPTRTMVYTGANVKMIIFKDSKLNRFGEESLADGFFREYKGTAGIYKENTLRGDVVYNEALRLGLDSLQQREIALAVDPLNAYRVAVKSGTGPHTQLSVNQMMFYTSVCIHVPNSKEIGNDLRALLSKEQLEAVLNRLSDV